MVEEFEKRVQKKIDELMIAEREATEALEKVRDEKGRYLSAMTVWRQEMKTKAPSMNGASAENSFAGMAIADAAERIMRESGGKMRTADLARRLKLVGVTKAKGNGAYSSVLKTLQRKTDVFRERGTGTFELVK